MKRPTLVAVLLLLLLAGTTRADVYMHNMRGSNNRLNENSNNRNNANRLFDSQNNNRGGYNVGDDFAQAGQGPLPHGIMTYYTDSELILEWTNQHGCGVDHPKVHCEIILQYMCQGEADNALWRGAQLSPMRDGTTTATIDEAAPNDLTRGVHEPVGWYDMCKTRERNMGLFLADQNPNGDQAIFTRQDNAGTRHGFECPEERDYYPYWHPTPWKDIAILTWNASMCEYYQSESNNVKEKGLCSDSQFNNPEACSAGGGTWVTYSHGIDAPECLEAGWTRDNHNGNAAEPGNNPLRYTWKIPDAVSDACVLRIRYNISTGDYWGYDFFSLDASFNDENSPIEQDPTVDLGFGPPALRLALNTDQYGRTFQDRSHIFKIAAAPIGGKIHNLNVRGRRGNIVSVYPAVEYDFIPNNLTISSDDWVHIQWTGSTTTPDGDDKNNIVQIWAIDQNLPMDFSEVTMFPDLDTTFRFATVGAPDDNYDTNLDDRPAYYDGGLVKFSSGVYHYLCTRNNNFSNRSQKGTIIVN